MHCTRKTWMTFARWSHHVEVICTTIPPRPCSASIGTATTVSPRVEKRRMLQSFIMKNLLTATNTFHCEDDGATNIYTCDCNGNHESQQIDYIFSSDTSLRSRTFDSSATRSDHWGLTAAVKSNRARTPRKKIARKPIGWDCRDRIGYNNVVLRSHGTVTKALFALYFFTDGWARNISRREKYAGWGFTAMI